MYSVYNTCAVYPLSCYEIVLVVSRYVQRVCFILYPYTLMQGSTSKQVLELVAKAMSNDVELWNRYFNDFVLLKLRLDSEDSVGGIAQQILHTFMSQLHGLEALDRVINLHAYLHVYQLDLAKMASVLRPLNKLHKVRACTAPVVRCCAWKIGSACCHCGYIATGFNFCFQAYLRGFIFVVYPEHVIIRSSLLSAATIRMYRFLWVHFPFWGFLKRK